VSGRIRDAKVLPVRVGIVGGTGPLGAGLGLRLAAAGSSVVIGSREEVRAEAVVAGLLSEPRASELDLRGAHNLEAAGCEMVVVATPWEGAVATVEGLADELAGRTVVSVGNALVKHKRELQAVAPPRGSVASLVQAALPKSRVSAACHHLPAPVLMDLDAKLDSDVLVCSDYPDATEATIAMLSTIEGLRPLNAGSLAQAGAIEAFTAVLVTLNIRYKAHSTLKIGGV
jgi:8-hydroxy-5-deazaflavin:NADPH oxidoreductase